MSHKKDVRLIWVNRTSYGCFFDKNDLEVINFFVGTTQLRMKFILLMDDKKPIVGILTFIIAG